MSEAFDPYYTWLSISPEKQPPTLYQLLGLQAFEDHIDVIQNAADRQMSHLRTFQSGKHSAESQKLLNEVSAAKLTLLNPERKAAYDAELREFFERRGDERERGLAGRKRALVAGAWFAGIAVVLAVIVVLAGTLGRGGKEELQEVAEFHVVPSPPEQPETAVAPPDGRPVALNAEPALPAPAGGALVQEETALPVQDAPIPVSPFRPVVPLVRAPSERTLPPRLTPIAAESIESSKTLEDERPGKYAVGVSAEGPDGQETQSPLMLTVATPVAPDTVLPSGAVLSETKFAVPRDWQTKFFPDDAPVYVSENPDGSVQGVYTFNEGKLHGPAAALHPNGHLWVLANYNMSSRDGPLRLWGEDTRGLLYAEYLRGRKNGLVCLFRDGRPWFVQECDKGEVVAEYLVRIAAGKSVPVAVRNWNPEDAHEYRAAVNTLDSLDNQMKEGEDKLKKGLMDWYRKQTQRQRQELFTKLAPQRREDAREREMARRAADNAAFERMWRAALHRSGL